MMGLQSISDIFKTLSPSALRRGAFIFAAEPQQHSLPCKFVLAEDKNLSANLCDYLALIFWPAVLQNMLNDVVTILILQEAAEV